MLSPAVARELRGRGHDVLAIADHPGWVALSDPGAADAAEGATAANKALWTRINAELHR